MSVKNTIIQQIKDSISVKELMLNDPQMLSLIESSAEIITRAYQDGFKTLLAGNGGSAADAQHIAGEFVSRFYFDRPGIPSLAI